MLRKQHIVEQADGQDRTFYRLLHADFQRRLAAAGSTPAMTPTRKSRRPRGLPELRCLESGHARL